MGVSDPMGAAPAAQREHETLLARWLELTRVVLPGMAEAARWPIRLDHCFMRVCLDAAMGEPWHLVIRRPAVRHLTTEQLANAVSIAERLREDPELLPALNRQSLLWRGRPAAGLQEGQGVVRSTPSA